MNMNLSTIRDGEKISNLTAILKEIKLNESSNGSKFYSIILADKYAEIKGKIWSDKFSIIKNLSEFKSGDVVNVEGLCQLYMNNLQIIIHNLDIEKNYDLSELTSTGKYSLVELKAELENYIDKIKNPKIKDLIKLILKDKIYERYCESPAAVNYHHAFIGGLLEHVVEMLNISDSFRRWYSNANFDIVIAGIILHDIGKIYEIQMDGLSYTFSSRGRLIGHINIGIELVSHYITEDFPQDIWMQIQHIMISHHRELEYGSAVVPSSIEAAIVSVCDLGSSWIRQFDQAINESSSTTKEFSEFKKTIGAGVYLRSNTNKSIEHENQRESIDHQPKLF